MSVSGPWLYAWCDETDRGDALAAALSALVIPGGTCGFHIESIDNPDSTWRWRDTVTLSETVAAVRAGFTAGTHVFASFGVKLNSGSAIELAVECNGEEWERRYPSGPLCARPGDRSDLLPWSLRIALGGTRSVEVEAAILAMQVQQDLEDLMVRLCAPDARARVTAGAWTEFADWGPPTKACATYHTNAALVAHDLALTWVNLRDGDKVAHSAGMPTDVLHARVDAAPRGARVAVEDGAELSREAVLKALTESPAALLDALEASAVADEEWRTVESAALETIAATKEGTPTCEVDVTSRKHVQFIERHAPYHVRRLPSGGVVLATHPYRTLWPLWADALFLLDITS
ncbi:hypothetical protein [Sorangium sp. So ce385]|uniref:hypothetical protein n=1 Tax=Sorangium sp. So ce385 TaxID=3133308 RepID=UPI003F5CB4ED